MNFFFCFAGRFSVGQNLSWGTYKLTWLQAMSIWSKEVKDFRYGQDNNLYAVGHYTQVSQAITRPYHYENMPMQYIEIFSVAKIENFIRKFLILFLFLLKT